MGRQLGADRACDCCRWTCVRVCACAGGAGGTGDGGQRVPACVRSCPSKLLGASRLDTLLRRWLVVCGRRPARPAAVRFASCRTPPSATCPSTSTSGCCSTRECSRATLPWSAARTPTEEQEEAVVTAMEEEGPVTRNAWQCALWQVRTWVGGRPLDSGCCNSSLKSPPAPPHTRTSTSRAKEHACVIDWAAVPHWSRLASASALPPPLLRHCASHESCIGHEHVVAGGRVRARRHRLWRTYIQALLLAQQQPP
jgi:hypothetical protein